MQISDAVCGKLTQEAEVGGLDGAGYLPALVRIVADFRLFGAVRVLPPEGSRGVEDPVLRISFCTDSTIITFRLISAPSGTVTTPEASTGAAPAPSQSRRAPF